MSQFLIIRVTFDGRPPKATHLLPLHCFQHRLKFFPISITRTVSCVPSSTSHSLQAYNHLLQLLKHSLPMLSFLWLTRTLPSADCGELSSKDVGK
ncbi:hypothetical protein HN873_008282 [Arachis hypogaea]